MVLLSSFLVRRPLYLELGSSHPVLWASYLVPRPLHRMPELSCGIQKYSAQCVGPHTWYAGSLIWFQDPIILISETMSLLSNAGLSFVVSCVESSHVGLGHLCLVPGPFGDSSALFQGPSIPRRALYPEPRLIPYLYTYVLLPELRTHSHCTTTIRLTLECFCLASDLSSDLPLKIVT